MDWSDDAEVTSVESGDLFDAETLGDGYNRCISATESKVCVLLGQARHAGEVVQRQVDKL